MTTNSQQSKLKQLQLLQSQLKDLQNKNKQSNNDIEAINMQINQLLIMHPMAQPNLDNLPSEEDKIEPIIQRIQAEIEITEKAIDKKDDPCIIKNTEEELSFSSIEEALEHAQENSDACLILDGTVDPTSVLGYSDGNNVYNPDGSNLQGNDFKRPGMPLDEFVNSDVGQDFIQKFGFTTPPELTNQENDTTMSFNM